MIIDTQKNTPMENETFYKMECKLRAKGGKGVVHSVHFWSYFEQHVHAFPFGVLNRVLRELS